MRKLFYFGCDPEGKDKGHFMWDSDNGHTCRYVEGRHQRFLLGIGANVNLLRHFVDSGLPPLNNSQNGLFNYCIIPPAKIIAWWDNSVDGRGGSNSAFIGYGYDNYEQILEDAKKLYPVVIARQLNPLEIYTYPNM